MKIYLLDELAPFPLSLFDENGMRKTQKCSFYDNFACLSGTPVIDQNATFVLDGGSLLHRVVWQRDIIMQEILDKYVQYVRQYNNAVIEFDGYSEDTGSSLKTSERLGRQSKNVFRKCNFDKNTKITVKTRRVSYRTIATKKGLSVFFLLSCKMPDFELLQQKKT